MKPCPILEKQRDHSLGSPNPSRCKCTQGKWIRQPHWRNTLCSYTKAKATSKPTFMLLTKNNSMETQGPFVRRTDWLPEDSHGHLYEELACASAQDLLCVQTGPKLPASRSQDKDGTLVLSSPTLWGLHRLSCLRTCPVWQEKGRVDPWGLWRVLTPHQSCPRLSWAQRMGDRGVSEAPQSQNGAQNQMPLHSFFSHN